MTKQKKFKVVFDRNTNQYDIWFTDHTGEMQFSVAYSTFTKKGEMIDGSYDGTALISENVLWEINHLTDLGYKFVGIERK